MATLEKLRPELVDRSAGKTLVRDVRIEVRDDSNGLEALFVTLILGDPPVGEPTWPVDDLRALRNIVRAALEHIDSSVVWYVAFEPEHPDLDSDDSLF